MTLRGASSRILIGIQRGLCGALIVGAQVLGEGSNRLAFGTATQSSASYVHICAGSLLVGSRTGAVLRRCGLSGASCCSPKFRNRHWKSNLRFRFTDQNRDNLAFRNHNLCKQRNAISAWSFRHMTQSLHLPVLRLSLN
jgi:hypothetical protein